MAKNRQSKGICSVAVQGYKCLENESRIEIRPLTILAGANSSGKSSIMQPLLLMKQTLEASYDPGPLLLNGPNVKYTSFDQLVPRPRIGIGDHTMTFSVQSSKDNSHSVKYFSSTSHKIEISEMSIAIEGTRTLRLTPTSKGPDLHRDLSQFLSSQGMPWPEVPGNATVATYRDRCFLAVTSEPHNGDKTSIPTMTFSSFPTHDLTRMIHVPGLRGNPERAYERTASGPSFPGTFEKYVASTIADWKERRDDRPRRLGTMLGQLGLTREISARRVNDAQLELQVGRRPEVNSRGQDLVSVADVGFGVSQVLPVLVALLAADEGQLVYVEQPELHLHPRAQYALARIMVDAAARGVRLVAETHSALLLLHIRTLLAQGKIDPELVKLHWFSRDPKDGATSIHTAELDERGAFGDWPEDFGDVELTAEGVYLDAVECRAGEDGDARS